MDRQQYRCELVTYLGETVLAMKGDLREYADFLTSQERKEISALTRRLDTLRNRIDETE